MAAGKLKTAAVAEPDAGTFMLFKADPVNGETIGDFKKMNYIVVPMADIEQAESEGWYRTMEEAQGAYDAEQAAVARVKLAPAQEPADDGLTSKTRAELVAHAELLGMTVKSGWNDAELVKQIRKTIADAAK